MELTKEYLQAHEQFNAIDNETRSAVLANILMGTALHPDTPQTKALYHSLNNHYEGTRHETALPSETTEQSHTETPTHCITDTT